MSRWLRRIQEYVPGQQRRARERRAQLILGNLDLMKLAIRDPRIVQDVMEITGDDATLSEHQSSLRIPRSDTKYGALFGEAITDIDREYASEREPVGHFLVYRMARDIVKNWFRINDPRTDSPDPDLNLNLQGRLQQLNTEDPNTNFKREFRKGLEWERKYGTAYIVGQFDDIQDQRNLERELGENAALEAIYSYPRTLVHVQRRNDDPASIRYKEPEVYRIQTSYVNPARQLWVHYSRVVKVETRSIQDLAWSMGSVLDPSFDDLSSLRNVRWGMAQTIWRHGSGFPVVGLRGYSAEQLQAFKDSGQFSDLMSRSYALINPDNQSFSFEGAKDAALDPGPYYDPILEAVSAGSGVPKSILRGVVEGRLTGSEVNERNYWDVIANVQIDLDPYIRTLIGWAHKGETWTLPDYYEVDWIPGFEVSAETQSKTAWNNARANQANLSFMTLDEVRNLSGHDLDELNEAARAEIMERNKMGLQRPFNEYPEREETEEIEE